jgi:hypothetical protein
MFLSDSVMALLHFLWDRKKIPERKETLLTVSHAYKNKWFSSGTL